MAEIQISAKKVIDGEEKSAMITYDFGDTLQDCAEKFGDEVVFSNAVRNFKIDAQAAIRRMLEAGKSQEEITERMAQWRPGVRMERSIDVTSAFLSKWKDMTEEERQELLEKMKDEA